jgi:metal-responsive CopG/Arc/MetJ family transcriptional regulator
MSKEEKMSKRTKTTRTYSMDDELYNRFNSIINDKMLNRSKVVENLIHIWVKEQENNNNNDIK